MKNSQTRLIILVVVLVLVIAGGWYFITQSAGTSSSVATTTSATSSSSVNGASGTIGGRVSAHTTAFAPVTTTHATASSQGSSIVPPQIIEFNPAAGTPGTQVTVTGVNFSRTLNYVMFGSWGGRYRSDGTPDNQVAAVVSPDGSTITFTVPTVSASGQLCNSDSQCIEVSATPLGPGNYPVTVRTAGGTSNTVDFIVTK